MDPNTLLILPSVSTVVCVVVCATFDRGDYGWVLPAMLVVLGLSLGASGFDLEMWAMRSFVGCLFVVFLVAARSVSDRD
jgi:hypothetical protein